MKKQILLFALAILISFVGTSSICASENLIRTEDEKKVIFVSDDNGIYNYSWSFNKNDFKKNEFEFDKTITNNSYNAVKINSIIGEYIKKEYIAFNYHGNLPSAAKIKVPTSFDDGKVLNLYYYDDEKNTINLVSSNVKVIGGYVSFEIEHCSDYFVTLSVVKNAANSKDNNGILIIGMIAIVVSLIAYTIYKNKK